MADSNDLQSTGTPVLPPPANPSDPGHGNLIMGLTWTFTSLSLLVVGVRFWIRIAVTKLLSVEDWLMLASAVLNLACQACLTVSYRWGLGKHDKDLTFDQLVKIPKWIWISYTPGILSSITARISIGILLVRIFGAKPWLKWFLVVITILQVVSSLVLTITTWVQVSPIEGLWDPSVDARRLDPSIVIREGNVTGSLFALGDLSYVLFPVLVVWKLNMPLHRKVGLCVLLAMSLFTMGISITKAINAENVIDSTDDAQYNSSLVLLWSLTEQTLVIIMGSAPPLNSIARLKLPSVLGISASVRRLISNTSTGYKTEDSNGLGQSSHGIYYELGVRGQTLSHVEAGNTSTMFDTTDSHSIDPGKIRRTDQYIVRTGGEERHGN